jgi:hypothetical protein
MNTTFLPLRCFVLVMVALAAARADSAQMPPADKPGVKQAEPIPLDQLGAAAGRQYQGDGLSVTATIQDAVDNCTLMGNSTDLHGGVDGGTLEFTEPAPIGNRFYRLHKP